ncbi:MAG: SLC13 family permease [Gammaproteobacteria bacterium]|nr:SLC13 family permease [Gammaproteobacteria bacterium]MDE0248773.1 SLC13 family permease [Gammaproteobacteria bacterium]
MIATRCLGADETVSSFHPSVLFLLAGTILLGLTMETTGLADRAISHLMDLVGASGLQMLLGPSTSSRASSPTGPPPSASHALALQVAVQMGVDPPPFMLAVYCAESTSLAIPIGYARNPIVFGPRGQEFTGFVKIGTIINVLMWILPTLFVPLLYPF